jgi:hypothetical protein
MSAGNRIATETEIITAYAAMTLQNHYRRLAYRSQGDFSRDVPPVQYRSSEGW